MKHLKAGMDMPRENINLHVDKDVPEGIVGTVVKLINPNDSRSTIIHNVVQIKNGDIGSIKKIGVCGQPTTMRIMHGGRPCYI